MRHRVSFDGQHHDPRPQRCGVRKHFTKALLQRLVLNSIHANDSRLEPVCDEFRADPCRWVLRVERVKNEHLVAGADVDVIIDQIGNALPH